jgi:hypothetical protein
MGAPRKVSWLIAQLEKLDSLHGVERVLRTKELSEAAVKILAAEGDRGVWQALHRGNTTGAQVAEALGTTPGVLHNRSSRHLAAVKAKEQAR